LLELHDGTSNIREQKQCLALNEYNSFTIKENELVRDNYSRLNIIVNELNSIGTNKLGDADIVRKIISILPQQKYGSIITILHNLKYLSQMTPTLLINKVVAFEMSWKMGQQEPTSSRPYAFTCEEQKNEMQEEGSKVKFLKWRGRI
jgi:ATP-dependent Zn protease